MHTQSKRKKREGRLPNAQPYKGLNRKEGKRKMTGIATIIALVLAMIAFSGMAYSIGNSNGYEEGMEDAINAFQSFYEEEQYAGK